jgi:hypothetical protein
MLKTCAREPASSPSCDKGIQADLRFPPSGAKGVANNAAGMSIASRTAPIFVGLALASGHFVCFVMEASSSVDLDDCGFEVFHVECTIWPGRID